MVIKTISGYKLALASYIQGKYHDNDLFKIIGKI